MIPQSFLLVIVGVVAGPLFDLGYFHQLIFLGSVLVVFGMVSTTFRKTFFCASNPHCTDDAFSV